MSLTFSRILLVVCALAMLALAVSADSPSDIAAPVVQAGPLRIAAWH